KKLLDVPHNVVLHPFHLPQQHPYQILHQHPQNHMIIDHTPLAFNPTKNLVLLSLTTKSPPQDNKQKFYTLLPQTLQSHSPIPSTHLILSILQNDNPHSTFPLAQP
ncbi:tautomerase family protein, partial [Bacillus subtilis]|uniref:tautomerase family protein n=1 Tax=Bacillus subtilis TaxID=1423 RepID=UPI0011A2047F